MNNISSLYLHFPYCLHLCNYCDFYKHKYTPNQEVLNQFNQLIFESFAVHEKFLAQNQKRLAPLQTLYFGGGTPSLWSHNGVSFIRSLIQNAKIVLEKNCEFTIEIDPGTITEKEIDEWIKVGVNRFSVGVQSLNDKFLEIMDRKHGRKEIFELLEILHRKQLSFSIDFMIGLPYSEKYNRDIVAELEELKKYQPQHFSLYILSTRKNYVHREELPTNDFSAEEYLTVVQYLKSLGFKHYEVSNFALDSFESKHNLKYWNIEEVAAIGPNATGLIKINSEKQIRYKWKPQSPLYEIEILNQNEILLEKLYMNLRSQIGLDLSEIFENKIPLEVNKMVEGWVKTGYAQVINNRVILSSEGFLILDSLIGQMMHWV